MYVFSTPFFGDGEEQKRNDNQCLGDSRIGGVRGIRALQLSKKGSSTADFGHPRDPGAKATNEPDSTEASSEMIRRAAAAAASGLAHGRCTSCSPPAAGATRGSAAAARWPTGGGCRASVPEFRAAGWRSRAPIAAAPSPSARAAQRSRCEDPAARKRDAPRNAAACRWEACREERMLWSGDKLQPLASNS